MELLGSRDALASALSAAMADSVSTSLLYPLDAVKIRMGAHNLSFGDALGETVQHGVGELYTGIGVKLLQGFQQKFQYFYCYAILGALYLKKTGRKPGVSTDLALGYMAAMQGLWSTLPLEVTNVRVITAAKPAKSSGPTGAALAGTAAEATPKSAPAHGFLRTFADIVENEGPMSLYRTLPASAMLCINPAITYVVFENLKASRVRGRDGGALSSAPVLSTMEALVVGIISKSIAVVLTYPLMRAKIAMSVWAKKHERERAAGKEDAAAPDLETAPGLVATLRGILLTSGVAGLFTGLSASLVKGVLNATLMLVVKERVYTSVRALVASKNEPKLR